jgi:RHS repeat-associated protein
VDFFQGNTPIATITPPAPFIFTVNNLAQGSYTFTAIATDDQGATTTSNQATITVTPATAQVYYIYTDQLNTPRAITNQQNQVVWRWDNNDPFGGNSPDEDPDGDGTRFTCNLRFPGQYADRETGMNYNYFRDYDPSTGRYIQSDPIGLEGGANTYTYAKDNSLNKLDQYGLRVCGREGSITRFLIPDYFIFGVVPPVFINFTAACQRHDDCYDTCRTIKSDCDKRFYIEMLVQCFKALSGAYVQCFITATAYFTAVNQLGDEEFREAQKTPKICKECR